MLPSLNSGNKSGVAKDKKSDRPEMVLFFEVCFLGKHKGGMIMRLRSFLSSVVVLVALVSGAWQSSAWAMNDTVDDHLPKKPVPVVTGIAIANKMKCATLQPGVQAPADRMAEEAKLHSLWDEFFDGARKGDADKMRRQWKIIKKESIPRTTRQDMVRLAWREVSKKHSEFDWEKEDKGQLFSYSRVYRFLIGKSYFFRGYNRKPKAQEKCLKARVSTIQNAIDRGNRPAIQAFLASGLNPNTYLWNGETVLARAAKNGNVPMCQDLKKAGANAKAYDNAMKQPFDKMKEAVSDEQKRIALGTVILRPNRFDRAHFKFKSFLGPKFTFDTPHYFNLICFQSMPIAD